MKFFIPISALIAGAMALPAATQGGPGGSCSGLSDIAPELTSMSELLPELAKAASGK